MESFFQYHDLIPVFFADEALREHNAAMAAVEGNLRHSEVLKLSGAEPPPKSNE